VSNSKPTADAAKSYADYLDKEMTIMGILSTFCVIALGGCVTALSGIAKDHSAWFPGFWVQQGPFIFLGMIALLFSAFFFYRQRSILAYYVGQIYLSLFDSNLVTGSTTALHKQADRWSTWIFYRQAFLCLFTASVLFGRVGLSQVLPSDATTLKLLVSLRVWELWALPLICIFLSFYVYLAFRAYPDDDDLPYIKFLLHPKRFEKDVAGDKP
jgi:hypothetical protein